MPPPWRSWRRSSPNAESAPDHTFAETASVHLAKLEPKGARLACVVSIAHGGEPQHLNRLIARLRQRMPAVPMLAGLWLADEGQRRPGFTLDADIVSGSLHEAVEAVLAAAEADPAGRRGRIPNPTLRRRSRSSPGPVGQGA